MFHLLKQSKKSRARLGILKTPHGEIETPAFVPVATQATVKTLTAEEVKRTNTQLLIANTYHLHIRPGEDVVKKHGDLHKFMQWDRPLMTDSGGFQVFSLGFGKDLGTGKIIKTEEKERIAAGNQPTSLKITEEGVRFKSYLDGHEIFLTPKESIRIQESLGADIIFAFDECPSPLASKEYVIESMARTHRWAKESLHAKKSRQALYGIVQGGRYDDLRKESAKIIGGMQFDGFGIGGEFGNKKEGMGKMLGAVLDHLPKEKPRHLLGIGHPEDIKEVVKAGIDTFDCIIPTHYARHGAAFTSEGKINMELTRHLKDKKPVDPKCKCEVCATYSRSYICHLLRAKEITGMRLLTMHNLFYFNKLLEDIRAEIRKGKL